LGIENETQASSAIQKLTELSEDVLLEEMITEPIIELIIGAVIDPTGIWTLTIGAGGILTELLADAATLTLPTNRSDIEANLRSLKVNTLLQGYRGQPGVDLDSSYQPYHGRCIQKFQG